MLSGDFFFFVAYLQFTAILMDLSLKNYSLIKIIIIVELIFNSSSVLMPTSLAQICNSADGEIYALYAIATAAAESALILSLYINLLNSEENNLQNL